jgi:hypothetical protein
MGKDWNAWKVWNKSSASFLCVAANWFKTKWKSLVGSFDRSHKRRTKNQTGSAGGITKQRNWPWYEQLLFLKDRTVVRGK